MSQNANDLDAVGLGLYLQELRGDLSQYRVAKLVGSSPGAVKQWEQGEVVPSVASLYGIARGFGVPIERLIARLVPEYRRTAEDRADEVVLALLETTPPDALTPAAVQDALPLPPTDALDADGVDALILAAVAGPMPRFLADLIRATTLDDGALDAVAEALGDLASRLPGTVFTHRDAYPVAASRVLDEYDAAISRAARALSADDPTRQVALRVRFAGWGEAARVVCELQGLPVQRHEAVVLALGTGS